jgi:FkbM family methyltransferase
MDSVVDPLVRLIQPDRLTAVVDIGANPLEGDGEPPYKGMLDARLCTVVGFEPQPEALATLNARKSDLETYLPYAVGDGTTGTLKVCRARGMTSLLTPNPRVLNVFPGFSEYGRVIGEIPVETRTLDSISEISALDLLKIDVQGMELAVFRHGGARLAEAVAIQAEVSFMPLYVGQPVFGDIDLDLRARGFVPHMFVNVNKRMILPLNLPEQPFAAMNQLLEADIVYVIDFTNPSLPPNQLKQLALIAHHCYRSYDLAANCIYRLQERNLLPSDSVGRYLAMLKG